MHTIMYAALFFFPVLLLLRDSTAIPLEDFYPFGSDTPDLSLAPNDDGSSSLIQFSAVYPFFGTDHTTIFVNNNGVISFNQSVSTFTPSSFPLGSGLQLIAPYWADVDTRGTGTVWYRETANADILSRARRDIQMAFANQNNFQPLFAFIATWDAVGYFNSRTDLTNTFQCVLVSDGSVSFVIFLYADGLIQWTTGDASGGSGGFGGTPAQVGFNAGDGVRFASVPGSQTADIVNIDTTSNIGTPGVWTFQVNEQEIDIGMCSEANDTVTSSLNIFPRFGSELGGTAIQFSGPCLEITDLIICNLDGVETTGVYVSQLSGICITSPVGRVGLVTLNVTVVSGDEFQTVRYSDQTRFYSVAADTDQTVDVMIDPDSLTQLDFPMINISWNPESLLPLIDPNSFTIDIFLTRLSNDTMQFELFEVLGRNLPNTGFAMVSIPENNITLSDVIPLTIELGIGDAVDDSEALVAGTVKKVGRRNIMSTFRDLYSRVRSFSDRLLSTPSNILRERCIQWCESQPENIGDMLLDMAEPCPRTIQQARAPNSGFSEGGNRITRRFNRILHPGAAACFRQTAFPRGGRVGNQCCYSNGGTLIVVPPAGGTVDRVSPEIDTFDHFIEDVVPAIYCCTGEFRDETCNRYLEKRPIDNGSRFQPPIPACTYGDPHLVTLDGLKYTFNGLGEFRLIESNNFVLQGRMIQATNNDGTLVSATVFSAIVAQDSSSDVVQLQLSSDGTSIEVIVDGELITFLDEIPEAAFNGVTITALGSNSFFVAFGSGASVQLSADNGMISQLIITLPTTFQSLTRGLLGDYDGNEENDLLPRNGDTPIPLDSSLEDIHNMFGLSWIIDNPDDSLFIYGEGESWSTFFRPEFIPRFDTEFSDPLLEAQAIEICGDDFFCLFDIANTERPEVGISTMAGNEIFEQIVEISQPVVCIPPCVNGVCVSNNTCGCSPGYTGELCDVAIVTDPDCDIEPCLNGGTCTTIGNDRICVCPFGFSGLRCEIEDAPHVEVEFERQYYSVIEGHYIEVCILIRGTVNFEIILDIHARSKFLQLYGRIIIEVGIEVFQRRCVTFHFIDDLYFNSLERELNLDIVPAEPYPGLYFGSNFPAWLFLIDPSIVEVGFAQDEYEVTESSGSVSVCIELFSDIYLASPLLLRVESDGGDAEAGIDYEVVNEIVALPSSGIQGVQACFNITILNDDEVETPEIFYVHIIQFDHRVIVTRKYAVIRILSDDDDEIIQLHFTESTPSVDLNALHLVFYANPLPIFANCTVTRAVGSDSVNCTNGGAWFNLPTSVRPHDITVNATFPNGETRALDRRVRSETTDVCWVHLINVGVTVDGNSVSMEFQGTGPAINSPPRIQAFECTLYFETVDNVFQEGPCTSPLSYDDLPSGCYWVQIRPVDDNCRRRIRIDEHFCIV